MLFTARLRYLLGQKFEIGILVNHTKWQETSLLCMEC